MRKGRKVLVIILSIVTCLCFVVTAVGVFFAIASGVCEADARVVPSYAMTDLAPLIEKDVWTDEDYETIYRQTGLTRAGADTVPREELPDFQRALFYDGEVRHDEDGSVTPHDAMFGPSGEDFVAPIVPLEAGDILITSTTHLFGWRLGHAALVLDSAGTLLQSTEIGAESGVSGNGARWFRRSANFMVLRLKDADRETRAAIAEAATERLQGIPYNVFVGFFTPKDQCKDGRTPNATHCAHLVWQSFMNAGYDLDSTGGPLVVPRDISRSPLLEVLQVYGFDLDEHWK